MTPAYIFDRCMHISSCRNGSGLGIRATYVITAADLVENPGGRVVFRQGLAPGVATSVDGSNTFGLKAYAAEGAYAVVTLDLMVLPPDPDDKLRCVVLIDPMVRGTGALRPTLLGFEPLGEGQTLREINGRLSSVTHRGLCKTRGHGEIAFVPEDDIDDPSLILGGPVVFMDVMVGVVTYVDSSPRKPVILLQPIFPVPPPKNEKRHSKPPHELLDRLGLGCVRETEVRSDVLLADRIPGETLLEKLQAGDEMVRELFRTLGQASENE